MDYNSIDVFDYWAKEACPVLFAGKYESYTHYLKRSGRRYESVRYLAEKKTHMAAREPMYDAYVYHLEKPRSASLTVSMLERCTLAHWVYNCSLTSGTFTSSRICYYWDTTKGMFLILPECDNHGRVNDIVIRVYDDLETFIIAIFNLWSDVAGSGIFKDGSIMDHDILMKELFFA